MKVAIVGDIHICKAQSIINRHGEKFSKRLENCIQTVNWIEQITAEKNCDLIIYLGDVFDKAELDDETITAIKEINWNSIKKYFIVGNHESSVAGLKYSSVKALEADNRIIIDQPTEVELDTTNLLMVPYITEIDRQSLENYWTKPNLSKKKLICMHNDIADINLGPIVTKTGFSKKDILDNSDLCIDGHLHNGTWIEKGRIRTLGNITGLNLGEDAFKYSHNIMILDTDTFNYEDIENPFAFNFYKIDINSIDDFKKLNILKTNAVVSIKCNDKYVEQLRTTIPTIKNITESRIIVTHELEAGSEDIDISDLTLDHIQKFIECCKAKLDNTKLLDEELEEICK